MGRRKRDGSDGTGRDGGLAGADREKRGRPPAGLIPIDNAPPLWHSGEGDECRRGGERPTVAGATDPAGQPSGKEEEQEEEGVILRVGRGAKGSAIPGRGRGKGGGSGAQRRKKMFAGGRERMGRAGREGLSACLPASMQTKTGRERV